MESTQPNPILLNIESQLKQVKNDIKETYKKVKSSKTEQDSEILMKQFKTLYNSLYSIHQESYKLDNEKVWEECILKADDNKFDEFEKENYDHLILISQLMRGTIKGISDYNNKIN